jgi:hypothetical protein
MLYVGAANDFCQSCGPSVGVEAQLGPNSVTFWLDIPEINNRPEENQI